jgi:hypothetical protein
MQLKIRTKNILFWGACLPVLSLHQAGSRCITSIPRPATARAAGRLCKKTARSTGVFPIETLARLSVVHTCRTLLRSLPQWRLQGSSFR